MTEKSNHRNIMNRSSRHPVVLVKGLDYGGEFIKGSGWQQLTREVHGQNPGRGPEDNFLQMVQHFPCFLSMDSVLYLKLVLLQLAKRISSNGPHNPYCCKCVINWHVLVCCEAVRSAILATAWLLVISSFVSKIFTRNHLNDTVHHFVWLLRWFFLFLQNTM